MKLVLPEINHVFETEQGYVNELVIENQGLFYRILMDVYNQLQGLEGIAVLSENDKQIPISKYLEVLDRFIPFELSKKNLVSKLSSELEKKAIEPENYQATMELLSGIEKYLSDISFDFNCDINFNTITIPALIKATGISFCEDYDSLGEKVIDYMELVYEFDKRKLFLIVNIRSYMDDTELEMFIETVNRHGYSVVLIESKESVEIKGIKRYIVDIDLCEIC